MLPSCGRRPQYPPAHVPPDRLGSLPCLALSRSGYPKTPPGRIYQPAPARPTSEPSVQTFQNIVVGYDDQFRATDDGVLGAPMQSRPVTWLDLRATASHLDAECSHLPAPEIPSSSREVRALSGPNSRQVNVNCETAVQRAPVPRPCASSRCAPVPQCRAARCMSTFAQSSGTDIVGGRRQRYQCALLVRSCAPARTDTLPG